MRDVAKASGISLGTLYHYLAGKEDLLYRCQRRVLEAAVTSAEAALAGPGARDRLRALLTDHVRRVLAQPAEAAIVQGRLGVLRGDRGRRVEELRRTYLELVRATTETALRRHASRAGREARERTTMLLGMVDALALEAHADTRPASPTRLARRALAIFLSGALGTPKSTRSAKPERRRAQ